MLSVDDVRHISGVNAFRPTPDWDLAAPTADPNTPGACRPVYDDDAAFGSDWKQFRSAAYGALIEQPILPGVAKVTQTVAIYDTPSKAKAAFDAVQKAIPGCVASGSQPYNTAVENPDPSTVLLNGEGWDSAFRVSSSALFRVSSLGLTDDDRVVIDVLNELQKLSHS
ncbi:MULTISPECIES: sensor domain-containing protein [unclassified Mycolicibacterium]|uniref:sensor domain-containing protein n=1 Tax=unclassified Mycolicibacterium TaxID=2636767 RepID=UPI002ED782AF